MLGIPALAVSLGDPAGVGPELIAEAWARRGELRLPPFFVVGGLGLLVAAARSRGLEIKTQLIGNPSEAQAAFANALPVLSEHDAAWTPGVPSREGAELALASLSEATCLTSEGKASAVVTGPIAKSRLAEIGFTYPGQTEYVAAVCGVEPDAAVMMLAGPRLRTVPLTVHVALSAVPGLISRQLIESKARIVARALKQDFGLSSPRIAIAAIDPHAGEDGKIGTMDAALVVPAVAALRAEGIDASGPHPADALFAPHNRGTFDLALCMYHDQALIPIKALDFDEGVNVTLGLSIVRTSPDHGTAFGIAGTGKAHPGAMIAAIRMAAECAARRARG